MRGYLIVVFALSVLGSALTLPAANPPEPHAPKQPFEATSTEQVNFSAGGTVRVVNSYGYLTVEGWDEPEVQVNVIKSTDRFYDPGEKQEAERRLALVRVVAERRSDKELQISTVLPPRNPIFRSVLPLDRIVVTKPLVPNNKRGVTVEYRILVPRESRLVVRHDTGYVCVNDVSGDIDVHIHTGDMIVMLPDNGQYLVDARTRLGSVSSDVAGKGRYRFVGGTHFAYLNQSGTRHVSLRMGCGSIAIKSVSRSGPYWKD